MVARSHTHRCSLPTYEVGMLFFSRFFSHKHDWPLKTGFESFTEFKPAANYPARLWTLQQPCPVRQGLFFLSIQSSGGTWSSKALPVEHTGRALLSSHLPPCSSEEAGMRQDPLSDHQCVYFDSPSTQDASLEEGADRSPERRSGQTSWEGREGAAAKAACFGLEGWPSYNPTETAGDFFPLPLSSSSGSIPLSLRSRWSKRGHQNLPSKE